MPYTPISSLPVAPQRNDSPDDFVTKADAWVAALSGYTTEINSAGTYIDGIGTQVTSDKVSAEAAKLAAENVSGLVNYKGVWSAGTAYNLGDSVLYNNSYYISDINNNLGNTPADDANWSSIASLQQISSKADLTGADFTGSISAPTGKFTQLQESYATFTSSANAATVDTSTATVFSHTLTQNTTLTFSNPPATGTAYGMTIKIVQDAGASGYTVTWPASVDWAGATAPTLTATASAVDVFVFYTHDGGTTWYGFTSGLAMA